MKVERMLTVRSFLVPCGAVLGLIIGLSVFPRRAQAQTTTAGDKAVYNSSSQPAPSTVWIDASAFYNPQTQTPDICTIINGILTSTIVPHFQYPADGAVIDARGILPTTLYGAQSCNMNPWGGTPPANGWPPSTILLPASNITFKATWTLPNNTKISGEGPNTELTANDTFSGSDMVDMGSSSSCPSEGCSGVAVEHLKLNDNTDGGNGSLNGIVNNYSSTPSYVNDVALYNIGQTGIVIGAPSGQPGAIDSGPYTNISYSAANNCNGNVCPACAVVGAQTRGLHGFTCLGNQGVSNVSTAPGHAGIYVNASNNSIEDIHFEGFWDGVQIGDATTPVGNILVSNVTAGYSSGSGPVDNAIHICGPNSGNESVGACATSGTVSDVTILQSSDGNGGKCTTTIRDDVSGTVIGPTTGTLAPSSVPQRVGVYSLGEAVPASSTTQHSRFATTPSIAYTEPNCHMGDGTQYSISVTVVPTWGVGTTAATGNTCVTPGALYSNTAGASGSAVLVCTGTSPNFTWQSIP